MPSEARVRGHEIAKGSFGLTKEIGRRKKIINFPNRTRTRSTNKANLWQCQEDTAWFELSE